MPRPSEGNNIRCWSGTGGSNMFAAASCKENPLQRLFFHGNQKELCFRVSFAKAPDGGGLFLTQKAAVVFLLCPAKWGFAHTRAHLRARAAVWSPVVRRFDSGWCSNQGFLIRQTTHPSQPMGKVRSFPSAHNSDEVCAGTRSRGSNSNPRNQSTTSG